jgi:cytochrome c2
LSFPNLLKSTFSSIKINSNKGSIMINKNFLIPLTIILASMAFSFTSQAAGVLPAVYATKCAGCHGANGQGGIGPALKDYTKPFAVMSVTIRNGVSGTAMRSFPSAEVSDAEVAGIYDFFKKPTQVPVDSWWSLALLASFLVAFTRWKYKKQA